MYYLKKELSNFHKHLETRLNFGLTSKKTMRFGMPKEKLTVRL